MSKADELATKLKQTRHISADHAIDSWPVQVYELYHQIEAWLSPLTEVGLILRRNPTHGSKAIRTGKPSTTPSTN